MRSSLVFVSLVALCSVPGLAATPNPAAPAPARRLPVPADVSPKALKALRARMGQHGTSMENLVRAVVLLDRPTVKVIADRIVAEKAFDAAALVDLNLPPELFSEGEKLAVAARELAFVAATGRDNEVLAQRFTDLTHTCVSCHAGYLRRLPRKHNPIDHPAEPL